MMHTPAKDQPTKVSRSSSLPVVPPIPLPGLSGIRRPVFASRSLCHAAALGAIIVLQIKPGLAQPIPPVVPGESADSAPEVITKEPARSKRMAPDDAGICGVKQPPPPSNVQLLVLPASATNQSHKINPPRAEPVKPPWPAAKITNDAISGPLSDINEEIVKIVSLMPHGGGYSVQTTAKQNLIKAVCVAKDSKLDIIPALAKPSFCSSATYLVFLQVILKIEQAGKLSLTAEQQKLLLVANQADGVGVWGRWNANGPGTAKLFHDLAIGENFTDLKRAKRGDFLKIWWTDQIGAREKGHSVIYLGSGTNSDGEDVVRYWSSNMPDGYGEKSAPMSRIRHMLFSRLSNIQGMRKVQGLPGKDVYLQSMLKIDESLKSMLNAVGASGEVKTPLTQSRATSSL